VFRHSSCSRPLKDATNALPVGFPSRLKSKVARLTYAQ